MSENKLWWNILIVMASGKISHTVTVLIVSIYFWGGLTRLVAQYLAVNSFALAAPYM